MEKNPFARFLPALCLSVSLAFAALPAHARYADDFTGGYDDLNCSEDDCDCLEPDNNRFAVVSPCNLPDTGSAVVFTGAWDRVQAFFDEAGWTDGLPVVPPTPLKVEKFLRYVPSAADAVVATLNGRAVTATHVAANAVLAGCSADLMPVCVAMVRAMGEAGYLEEIASGALVPMAFVNGPVARQVGVDEGQGMTTEEVNACLARFVESALRNLAGVDYGGGSSFGAVRPLVFAENDEAALAAGWQPHHVREGHDLNESCVTMTSFAMWGNNSTPATDWPEEIMKLVAWDATEKNLGGLGAAPSAEHAGTERTVLVTPPVALALSALYRSKEALAGDLESTARRPMAMRAFAYFFSDTDGVLSAGKSLDEVYAALVAREEEDARVTPAPPWLSGIVNPDIMTGATLRAAKTRILVAGDASRNKTQVMPGGRSVTVALELPAAWDGLLAELGRKELAACELEAPDDGVVSPVAVPEVLTAGTYRILDPSTGATYLKRAGRLYFEAASNTLHYYPAGGSAAASAVLDPAVHGEFIRFVGNLGINSSFSVSGGAVSDATIRFPSNAKKPENNTVALSREAFPGTPTLHANNTKNSNAAGGVALAGTLVRLSATVAEVVVDLDGGEPVSGGSTVCGFLALDGATVSLDTNAPAGATAVVGVPNGDGTYRTITFARRANGTVVATYDDCDALSPAESAVSLAWTEGGTTSSEPFAKTEIAGVCALTRWCEAGEASFAVSVAGVGHGSGTRIEDACDRLPLAASNVCTLRLSASDWYTFRYDGRDDKLTLVRDVARAGLCSGGTIENVAGVYVIRPDGDVSSVAVSNLSANPAFAVGFDGAVVPGEAFEGLAPGSGEGTFSLALKPPVAKEVRFSGEAGGVSVAVETFSALRYVLEKCEDLVAGDFVPVAGTEAVGTGGAVDLLDGSGGSSTDAAFYRVGVSTPPASEP